MDETSVLVEAIKVGGAPSALVVVLWVFMQKWFSNLSKDLADLKDSFGKYKVKTEGRLSRVETKLNLSAPAAEESHGAN
jgi:hypothetical protein